MRGVTKGRSGHGHVASMHSIPRRYSLSCFNRLTGLSLALTLLATGGCTSRQGIAGERIRCVVDTSGTSVVLQLNTTITLDQPDMFAVAVDSRGEVYASPTRGGALMHWSATGVLLPMLGTTGEGPGQFAGGNITPFVVGGDISTPGITISIGLCTGPTTGLCGPLRWDRSPCRVLL